MHITISRRRNWFAVSAQRSVSVEESKIVKSTGRTLLNSNANSVAQSLNGSVGVIRISVSHVTRSNVVVIMFRGSPKINCRNVPVSLSVPLK